MRVLALACPGSEAAEAVPPVSDSPRQWGCQPSRRGSDRRSQRTFAQGARSVSARLPSPVPNCAPSPLRRPPGSCHSSSQSRRSALTMGPGTTQHRQASGAPDRTGARPGPRVPMIAPERSSAGTGQSAGNPTRHRRFHDSAPGPTTPQELVGTPSPAERRPPRGPGHGGPRPPTVEPGYLSELWWARRTTEPMWWGGTTGAYGGADRASGRVARGTKHVGDHRVDDLACALSGRGGADHDRGRSQQEPRVNQ